MDQQERAYQKLEKVYTAKTEVAAAAATAGGKGKRGAEAVVEGGGGTVEGDGARRKGKSGRWFD